MHVPGSAPRTRSLRTRHTRHGATSGRRLRSARLLGPLLALLSPLVPVPAVAAWAGEADPDPAAGFATITEDDLLADLRVLASPELEGRDSPSAGLARAAEHISKRLADAGYVGAGKQGEFRLPFPRTLPAPVPEACTLAVLDENGVETVFTYGEQFVPVMHTGGEGRGEAVFVGFGIDSDADKYDDVKGELDGRVAVILESEPRHKRLFDGPEISDAANLYAKLETLRDAGVAGVLVVRRPPPEPERAPKRGRGDQTPPLAPAGLGFRHTWATFAGSPPPHTSTAPFPVLEITPAVAQAIVGEDLLPLAGKIDKSGKAPKPVETGRTVTLTARSEEREILIDNVAGILRGSDPALADEYVVIGAHYDHLGVDPGGRVGLGADDNASGTAAMLEVATALAVAGPRRSILACAFAAEEDGLLGSAALADEPPVPKAAMVAMVNMDMVGFGEAKEVAVLGLIENPGFEKLLGRAQKLDKTGIKDIVMRQGQDLFERSDHYSFHRNGVPVLFFFEGLPISKNADYHTWRDTIDGVDTDKVARTARLVFNTCWLLATEDERPPPPERN